MAELESLGKIMFRRATLEDASAIAAIHVRAWQRAYVGIVPADYLASLSEDNRTEFWKKRLTESQSVILVAEESGGIVGWASGGPSRDKDAEGESEVYAIYVHPDSWARGIGKQLMHAIEDAISPCPAITLWVLRQNERAIDFYRKLGFELDRAAKSVDLGGKSLAEVRLRKGKPIKLPLPTPASDTPAAGAPVAPPSSAADR